jgi:hypothetical protein
MRRMTLCVCRSASSPGRALADVGPTSVTTAAIANIEPIPPQTAARRRFENSLVPPLAVVNPLTPVSDLC